ncbi:21310_t:CDS:1, partial [Gigaspora rosea]
EDLTCHQGGELFARKGRPSSFAPVISTANWWKLMTVDIIRFNWIRI